ncbi:MAG TPA: hypothetical protein VM759_04060 [Longimicrobium sp.]|nr:hypothetical protein [Longimicrobium sp.]
MLVTSFTTYGTPLIRYRIGDGVQFAEGSCSCGSSHPLVERIEGRRVDYLYSPERGRVSLSHLADVIKGLPNCVREMQFVQDDPRLITVQMVVDAAAYTPESDAKIQSAMRYRFGSGVEFRVVQVDHIPRETSGKFRLIKTSLRPEELAPVLPSGADAAVAG